MEEELAGLTEVVSKWSEGEWNHWYTLLLIGVVHPQTWEHPAIASWAVFVRLVH